MKNKIILLLILPAILFTCKKEKAIELVSCIVTSVEGEVTAGTDGGMTTAEPGDILSENHTILTGPSSSAEIQIGAKIVIRLREHSKLLVSELIKNGSTEKSSLKLLSGQVLIKSEKLSQEESFAIGSQTITTGIRGTEFTLVEEGDQTTMAVNEGSVAVRKNLNPEGMEELKKSNPQIAENLESLLNREEIVTNNQKITVERKDVEEDRSLINEKIEELKNSDQNKSTLVLSEIEDRSEIKKETINNKEKEKLLPENEFKKMKPKEDLVKPVKKIRLTFIFDGIPKGIPVNVTINSDPYKEVRNQFKYFSAGDIPVYFQFYASGYELAEYTFDPAEVTTDSLEIPIVLKEDEMDIRNKKNEKKVIKKMDKVKDEAVDKIYKNNKSKLIEEKRKKTDDALEELDKELESEE